MNPVVLLLLRFALAAPQIAFPINAQVPPVARLNEQFSFVMSPDTFLSGEGSQGQSSLTYAVSNTPTWLKFDGNTRVFSGTPQNGDAGAFVFNLTATDHTGSTAAPVTFIVSEKQPLTIQTPLSQQTSSLGYPTDGDRGVILQFSSPYSFSFDKNTFTHAEAISSYYAVSANNSPLPSWVSFDAKNLTFSGTTPDITSIIAPPLNFGVNLVASDYVGFAGGALSFNLILGAHSLTMKQVYFTENATDGSQFNFKLSNDSILLDSKPIATQWVKSVSANTTNWLSFDSQNLSLSGTPKSSNDSDTVSITITDIYGDVVYANVNIRVDGQSKVKNATSVGLFKSPIPDVNATLGSFFDYSINSTYLQSSNTTLEPSYVPAADAKWLSFNPGNNSFTGTPTQGWKSLKVSLKATNSGISNTTDFTIYSQDATAAATTTSDSGNSSSTDGRTISIVVGTLVPLALLIGLIALIVCCCRRRRNRRSMSPIRSLSPGHNAISRPLPTAPAGGAWPSGDEKFWDEPRRMSALEMFKRDSGLSGFVAEIPSSREKDLYDHSTGARDLPAVPAAALTIDTDLANHYKHGYSSTPGGHNRGPVGYGHPRRSYQNNLSSNEWMDSNRNSDASLATVSTNEIFSVRLVDSPNVASPKSPANPFRGTLASQQSSIAPAIPPIFDVIPPSNTNTPNLNVLSHGHSRQSIGSYSSSGPSAEDHARNSASNSDFYTTDGGSSRQDEYDHGHGQAHLGEFRDSTDENGERVWYPRSHPAHGAGTSPMGSAEDARVKIAQLVHSPLNSPKARLVEFTKRRPVSSEAKSPRLGSERGEMFGADDSDPVFL